MESVMGYKKHHVGLSKGLAGQYLVKPDVARPAAPNPLSSKLLCTLVWYNLYRWEFISFKYILFKIKFFHQGLKEEHSHELSQLLRKKQ